VYLVQGQTRKPCVRAEVVARVTGNSAIIQSVLTDAVGRYSFPAISGRVSVMPAKPGFFPRAFAGGDRELMFDIVPAEQVDGADFDLVPGGVINGRITEPGGMPMEGAVVLVWPVARPGSADAPATSDDRGIYRAFGLEPGRYLVFARPGPSSDKGSQGVYYRDTPDASRAEPIDVTYAGEITGIDLTLRPSAVFRVSGKTARRNPEDRSRMRVTASSAARSLDLPISYSAPVNPDGSFAITDLPAGPYVVTARSQDGESVARARIDVSSDIQNLVLETSRPGRITGQVVLSSSQDRPKPSEIRLRAIERSNTSSVNLVARAPNYRFDSGEISPGTYTLELASSSGFVIQVTPRREIAVAEGAASNVRVDVGLDLGKISGVVKGPGGDPSPHARVALAVSSADIRSVQADQHGRYEFENVPPGDYRICAWPIVDYAALYRPDAWPADRARRVTVAPGAQTQMDFSIAAGVKQ
jgi:hypothetical protein